MEEKKVLEIINSGKDTAYGLLYDADKNLITRFKRLDKAIAKLLSDVRKHFPDARYYTASGGFNLILGNSHDKNLIAQRELIALNGHAQINDGDF